MPTHGSVLPIDINEEVKKSYMDYAMSVIVGRALPDVRDGLKPVQRRILYAMYDEGMTHNKPHKRVLWLWVMYWALPSTWRFCSLRCPGTNGPGFFLPLSTCRWARQLRLH